MSRRERKRLLLAAGLLLCLGMVNIFGAVLMQETPIFYNGQRLELGSDKERISTADFLTQCGLDAKLSAEFMPLEELCAALEMPMQYDQAEDIYVLGDNSQYAAKLPVLMYHHLLPEDEMWNRPANNITLTVEEFAAQMDYLKANGWQSVSLQEAEDFVAGKKLLEKKSVLITFDDGFLSNYKYAYPILKEHGFTAVLFVLTDYLATEEKEFDPKLMQYLTADDLNKMQDVFAYGSHTANLHRNEKHSSELCTAGKEQIVRDLQSSRQLLHETRYFSYPYGLYNQKVLEAVKEAGFALAFTVEGRCVKMNDDPYTLGRFDMYRYRSLDKFQELMESCAY